MLSGAAVDGLRRLMAGTDAPVWGVWDTSLSWPIRGQPAAFGCSAVDEHSGVDLSTAELVEGR